MDRRCTISGFLAAWLVLAAVAAQAAVPPLTTERVASGLSRPVGVTSPPGDTQRLFIIEQHTGNIKILNLVTGTINPTPFLTVPDLETAYERGLLGLAFHPDYSDPDNGYFFVNLTATGGTTHIRRYRVSAGDPDVANPLSATTVMTYAQPFANHNGGWLGFGPDGYLYIGAGDGGSGNDPGNRAQDITNQRLGKILRIDVDGTDLGNYSVPPDNPFVGKTGDDEIWAYGLRNPWRCSFDRLTGDLWIGDVGQNAIEEIDFQPASSSGGENYGWRLKEGTRLTGLGSVAGLTLVDPIHEYTHADGHSVTGGYVYRGAAIPELAGTYFFADYSRSRIWTFRYDGANLTEFTERTAELVPDVGSINSISSFGEDGAGELYIVDLGGEVFRLNKVLQIEVAASFDPGEDWVYQNTPGTLAKGGHRTALMVSVTDFVGNNSFTVVVAKVSGSGDGEVTIEDDPLGNPLVKYVVGGLRSDGIVDTGPLSLKVTVTGDVAGQESVEVPMVVRPLGDVDGNGGCEPGDVVALIMNLNGVPPASYSPRAFDLDANGGSEPGDISVLVNILNGLDIP